MHITHNSCGKSTRTVFHFKREIFTVLLYSQDFGIITNESLKRVTKWAAKYFTHEKSYYPVPYTSTDFANVNFMRPLPSEEINRETKSAMKDLWRSIVRWRQRTVRKETTKEKARALPPAVYTKKQDSTKVELLAELGNDFNSEGQPVGLSSDKGAVQATSEGGNVTDITFVDDCIVEVAVGDICRRIWHRLRKRLSWPRGWRFYPNYGL